MRTTGAACSGQWAETAAGNWPSTRATPLRTGLQHLLAQSRCDADGIRDDLQAYIAEHLGTPDGDPASHHLPRQPPADTGRSEVISLGRAASAALTLERFLDGLLNEVTHLCRGAFLDEGAHPLGLFNGRQETHQEER